MINEKPLTDITGVSRIIVNGKEYISLKEVFAIIEGYQRYRPESIKTTRHIRNAIDYAHITGRTLSFSLHDEYLKGD